MRKGKLEHTMTTGKSEGEKEAKADQKIKSWMYWQDSMDRGLRTAHRGNTKQKFVKDYNCQCQ